MHTGFSLSIPFDSERNSLKYFTNRWQSEWQSKIFFGTRYRGSETSRILRHWCHLPRCQMGVLAGLLSTSQFRLTDIPSTIGIPKPGKRVIANDGVSETGIKQLLSASVSITMSTSSASLMHHWHNLYRLRNENIYIL